MNATSTRKLMAGALALALIASACARKDEYSEQNAAQDSAAAPAATPAPAPAAPAAPTDAEIAHITVTANTLDIDAGQLAKARSKNAQVTEFAQRMITDHTGVNEQATQLAQRLNLTPADNSTSQSMKSSGDQEMEHLKTLSGAEFDRAYITHEVNYHQQVLDAIDNTLIPNAQNADLKALLQQTRPAIAAHLEMAKKIQSSLGQ